MKQKKRRYELVSKSSLYIDGIEQKDSIAIVEYGWWE